MTMVATMTRPRTAAEFGTFLRKHREAAGLSLRALQARTGIDNGLLSRWETGERIPRPEAARALDSVLHTGKELMRLAQIAHDTARGHAPVPMQLPAAPAMLTGRTTELFKLDDAVRRSTSTIVLEGPGGVGKSALMAHWLRHQDVRDRWPDGALHVDLTGYSPGAAPAEPGAVLERLLRDLGSVAVPDALDAQVRLWHTMLADRRVLVLLDDARTIEQVRPLLTSGAGCTTIITTRRRMPGLQIRDGAVRIPVRPLDLDAACDVLGLGGLHDRRAAQRVAEACERLPLALHAAAVVLAEQKDRPRDEVVALLTGPDRLDALNAAAADDPASALRVVLAASVHAMSEEAQDTLRRIAGTEEAPPGEVVCAELVREHLAADHRQGPELGALLRSYLLSSMPTAGEC